jgi:AbrB family looped-hinge helix DNA binding protein
MNRKLGTSGCCGVEAVVTVDARGQVVLPKELREAAGIAAGDKLAVVSLKSGERLCCLAPRAHEDRGYPFGGPRKVRAYGPAGGGRPERWSAVAPDGRLEG